MAKKSVKERGERKTKGGKTRRVVIGAAALAGVIGVGIIMFVSMGSNDQSGTTANKPAAASQERAKQLSYEIVANYPHDPSSFTQGLLWHQGGFYEGTGQYSRSKLRRLEFPSAKVLKEVSLSPELFGEGIARIDNRLYQLTWTNHRAFVYDLDSFQVVQEFAYDTEGWGLTYDGTSLIMSDGSSDLIYLDPRTFKPTRRLAVTMNNRPVTELNELEFIDGEVWANVWQTDLIMRIDPATGRVTSFLNLSGILPASMRTGSEDVLNGIAYDAEKKRVFVTGKLWPRIFEIKIK